MAQMLEKLESYFKVSMIKMLKFLMKKVAIKRKEVMILAEIWML